MNEAIRSARLSLYFIVGVLLSAVAVLSHAETIATSTQSGYYSADDSGSTLYGSAVAAYAGTFPTRTLYIVCAYGSGHTGATCATPYASTTTTYNAYVYYSSNGGSTYLGPNTIYYGSVGGQCPINQNWTKSGSTCTRPDCVAPSVRQPDGTCGNPCIAGATSTASRYDGTFSSGAANTTYGTPTPLPPTLCDGVCVGTPVAVTSCYSGFAKGSPVQCDYTITRTSEQCSGGNGTAPTYDPCFDQGGVSGTLNGLPVCKGTTPTNKTTTSSTSTTTNNTTTTTNTTSVTSCNAQGACSTTTTVVNSGGGGSTSTVKGPASTSQPGQAKMIADGNGGFNIDLPKDYQKDSTGTTTNTKLDEIKSKLTPGDGAADDSAVTGASHSAQSQTDLETQNTKFTDAASGGTDPTSGSKSSWSAAMSSGWWEPVTITGCQAFDSMIGGKSWHFDPCPTAAKISDIGSYVLWVVLVIGGFVMLTGGKSQA